MKMSTIACESACVMILISWLWPRKVISGLIKENFYTMATKQVKMHITSKRKVMLRNIGAISISYLKTSPNITE